MLIEDRLKIKPGIIKIKVDDASKKGVAVYDEQEIAGQEILETIEGIDNDFKIEKIEVVEEKSAEF